MSATKLQGPPKACPEAEKDLALIKIGTVSKLAGLSPSALRMYEQFGLVLPYKESSGQRLYSMHDIEAIRQFHDVVSEKKLSLASLAWLVRSAPVQSFRCAGCDQRCEVEPELGRQACWEMNADSPEWRKACRACPAYLSRCKVLKFHQYFAIATKRAPAAKESKVSTRRCAEPNCYVE
jgi:DNA-binding transcriptional MerR regulator